VSHRVEPGETIWAIARLHGVSTAALIEWNGIRDVRKLSVGRVLKIPAVHASTPVAPDPGEVMSSVSAEEVAPSEVSYRVQAGDTLWGIARRHSISVDALAESNRIEDVTKLRVGQLVVIATRAPLGRTAALALSSREPPDLRAESAAAETPALGIDAVDEVLATGEGHLRAAEFDEALEMAVHALRLLEDAPDEPGVGAQIARAEVLAATVHIAYARTEAAIRSLQRALRADEHLRLDPGAISPKVIEVLEEAQSQLD
jgi:LysM repeat protein